MYFQHTLSAYAFEEDQTITEQQDSDQANLTKDTLATDEEKANEVEIINGAEKLSVDAFTADDQSQQN